MSESRKGHLIFGHLFIYEGIGYYMYTVHLGSLGMIHNFQWIAGRLSCEIKNAEPLLTLHFTYLFLKKSSLFLFSSPCSTCNTYQPCAK